MTFWELNRKRFLIVSAAMLLGLFCFFYVTCRKSHYPFADVITATALSATLYFVFFPIIFLEPINSFRVIYGLMDDHSENSILPLFDSSVSVGLAPKEHQSIFKAICIYGTIAGLPVIVTYSIQRGNGSQIIFNFTPLMKESSKRIYHTSISFRMYLYKTMRKDIKPEVLQCVKQARENGLLPGSGRAISSIHYKQYD